MPAPSNDRLRSILVMLATAATIAFSGIAIAGFVNQTTPAEIGARYRSVLTPSEYAFSIWSLIYLGLAAFAVFQLLPANLALFRSVRTIYIASCLLNVSWLYFWLNDRPAVSLILITGLSVALFLLLARVAAADASVIRITKAAFGLYAGWVMVEALITLFVVLAAAGIVLSPSTAAILGVVAIILASAIAVLVVWKYRNYLFSLATAWGITAIAIKQSGNTPIVVASAIGVIISLLAALSFVMTLPTIKVAQEENE
jgi:benzodiazapine receptor